MGKLFNWFRGSQSKLHGVQAVKIGERDLVQARARRQSRKPMFYAFYYPKGREPGSGWKYPKAYFGPFESKSAAEYGVKESWPAKTGESRKRFKIQHLTPSQFKKIWGSLPEVTFTMGRRALTA